MADWNSIKDKVAESKAPSQIPTGGNLPAPAAIEQTGTFGKITHTAAAYGSGIVKGNTADTLGAPVDIINTMIAPVTKVLGIHSESPFLGSDHIRGMVGWKKDENLVETAGTTLSLGGAAKAMIVGAARLGKAGAVDVAKATELMNTTKANPASVYNLTGVYKGEEGGLRSVISDSQATLKSAPTVGGSKDLSMVMEHDKLFELYPELAKIKVQGINTDKRTGAYVPSYDGNPATIRIAALGKPEEQREILLHEIQHAVQGIEKWIGGGSPTAFIDPKIEKQAPAVQRAVREGRLSQDPATRDAAERWKNTFNEKLNAARYEAHVKYENLPGEQEARFTQDTRDLPGKDLAAGVLQMLKNNRTAQNWDTQMLPSQVPKIPVDPNAPKGWGSTK